jgi:large subunit ribosomal protein L6
MSKLANKSIAIPKGVTIAIHTDYAEIKGPKKTVQIKLHPELKVETENNLVRVFIANKDSKENSDDILGTVWALIRNTFVGVSEGFKIKLEIVGVGYRAQAQGHKLNLTLGFSHPVVFDVPKDVTVETPAQTEILLSSHDKQLLGQVAAKIRAYRFPECYKGKGIKFAGEVIVLKETKKK